VQRQTRSNFSSGRFLTLFPEPAFRITVFIRTFVVLFYLAHHLPKGVTHSTGRLWMSFACCAQYKCGCPVALKNKQQTKANNFTEETSHYLFSFFGSPENSTRNFSTNRPDHFLNIFEATEGFRSVLSSSFVTFWMFWTIWHKIGSGKLATAVPNRYLKTRVKGPWRGNSSQLLSTFFHGNSTDPVKPLWTLRSFFLLRPQVFSFSDFPSPLCAVSNGQFQRTVLGFARFSVFSLLGPHPTTSKTKYQVRSEKTRILCWFWKNVFEPKFASFWSLVFTFCTQVPPHSLMKIRKDLKIFKILKFVQIRGFCIRRLPSDPRCWILFAQVLDSLWIFVTAHTRKHHSTQHNDTQHTQGYTSAHTLTQPHAHARKFELYA
jgi:hypothetical protein